METAPFRAAPLLHFLLLTLTLTIRIDRVNSLSAEESQAMTDLLNSLGADAVNGSVNIDPCQWSTIRCDAGHVSKIYIKNNNLRDKTLPTSFSNLKYLMELHMMNNSLSGDIPSLNGYSSLQKLYLNDNNFTSVPKDCFDGMRNLQNFAIGDNPSLSAWQIPDVLSDASGLVEFLAGNASVTGTIPVFFGKLPSMNRLDLSSNGLSGGLPDEFAGSGIQFLYLNGQNLSGSIDVLKHMKALTEVFLNSNGFTGPLPDFSGLTALQKLYLNDNQFTGPVPESLISLSQLKEVRLGNNKLQGPTPKFGPAVKFDSDGLNNFCTNVAGGPCDSLVNTLISILEPWGYPLFFANSWTGNTPCASSWLGITCNGSNVIRVDLSNRNLSGNISSNFASLTSLQVLNLSNNNLTGSIPSELATMTQLKTIDVSNNKLCGNKPSFPINVVVKADGQDCRSPGVPGQPPNKSKSSSSSKVALAVCIPLAAVVLIIIIGIGIWWWRKNKLKQSEKIPGSGSLLLQHWPDQDGMKNTTAGLQTDAGESCPSNSHVVEVEGRDLRISIEVLKKATDNFSKENILGRGGFGTVYKGELPDGTKIAVKRMETGAASSKGLDEFTSEIAVLTKVRHRHLVSLLGYCLDGNERLLAYEYLPQGTLSRFLFHWNEEGLQPLEWARRLTIALDVARGVEYLHTLANQTFIHRDLKPSNILLGDNMRAKVADFGLVRLVPDDKASFATRLAGTFGYLAPEYAVTGRVTTKVDVYSFGVILMEIISGRKSLDESKPEDSMHLVTWFRRMHISRDVFSKVIDPMIHLDEETQASIAKVAELAVHCTTREPHQRPDMNHAVNVLHSLSEIWKPSESEAEEDDDGMTLAETLRNWQAFGDDSYNTYSSTKPGSVTNTRSTIPVGPPGFMTSLASPDGR